MAPSCGGKSSLMRYFRDNTNLDIAETDEEVVKANNGIWPDDELKNKVIIPKTSREIIARDNVIYFASYIPENILKEAKEKGFKIVLLNVPLEVLRTRNLDRMKNEGYEDVSPWFKGQLNNFKELKKKSLVDLVISADQGIEDLAESIQKLCT